MVPVSASRRLDGSVRLARHRLAHYTVAGGGDREGAVVHGHLIVRLEAVHSERDITGRRVAFFGGGGFCDTHAIWDGDTFSRGLKSVPRRHLAFVGYSSLVSTQPEKYQW